MAEVKVTVPLGDFDIDWVVQELGVRAAEAGGDAEEGGEEDPLYTFYVEGLSPAKVEALVQDMVQGLKFTVSRAEDTVAVSSTV